MLISNVAHHYMYTLGSVTDVALVGGGAYPQPGEISLSHNGVLFLDERPEFQRGVLEVMRQPLENKDVTISKARFTVSYFIHWKYLSVRNYAEDDTILKIDNDLVNLGLMDF